jgi:hypothetical protein
MSTLTIGTVVSRVRNTLKANKQDSFLTDKEIYLLFRKHVSPVLKRLDEKGHLMKFSSVFETLDYVELVESDKVEACCSSVKSGSTFRKTKLTMPMFTEGYYGPMVNSITSLDGSVVFKLVRNSDIYNLYTKNKDFQYNNWKYCWFLNDRLYFPNVQYPAVRIEGLFEDDISAFKCGEEKCLPRQLQSINVPDFVLAEVEEAMRKELLGQMQTPPDVMIDGKSPLK